MNVGKKINDELKIQRIYVLTTAAVVSLFPYVQHISCVHTYTI